MYIDKFILIRETVKQRDKKIKIFKERREWKRRDELIRNQRSNLDRQSANNLAQTNNLEIDVNE